MKTIQVCIIGLLLTLCAMSTTVYAQEGGAFSPYLVGTYDQRAARTVLQIINPTAKDFEVYIAFFDDNEKPLKCVKEKLSHNDLLEIDVKKLELRANFGVVKIVSHIGGKPVPGVVGFQRNYFTQVGGRAPFGVTESNLAAVPARILDGELKIIMDVCGK